MNELNCQHGVFMKIFKYGVFFIGKSGVGKSELALQLLDRKHQLIADDIVYFKQDNENVIGQCPPPLQGLLAIRDIGVIDVRKRFEEEACCTEWPIHLVVELSEKQIAPLLSTTKILDHPIQQLTCDLRHRHNAVIWLETWIHHSLVAGECCCGLLKTCSNRK